MENHRVIGVYKSIKSLIIEEEFTGGIIETEAWNYFKFENDGRVYYLTANDKILNSEYNWSKCYYSGTSVISEENYLVLDLFNRGESQHMRFQVKLYGTGHERLLIRRLFNRFKRNGFFEDYSNKDGLDTDVDEDELYDKIDL